MIKNFDVFDFELYNSDNDFFNNLLHLTMKEGLINSVCYDVFYNKLDNLLKNNKFVKLYNIVIKDEYVSLSIDFGDKNKKDFNNNLNNLLNSMGYFKSNIINEKGEKVKSIIDSGNKFLIFFQKRFDVPENTPNILHHSTTEHFYNKIKNIGLVAKSQNMVSDDLDRIYLTDNLAEALDFCTYKRFFLKNKFKNNELFNMNIDSWVVLDIDVSSIPDIKIYKDVKMENSYYTYNNIPPYSIKIKQRLNF